MTSTNIKYHLVQYGVVFRNVVFNFRFWKLCGFGEFRFFDPKNGIFRSQNWLFPNGKVKNVTKPDPNPISIVFGSFLDHLGWDKMILVKTIFRHISDPKIEAVWDEKWSDDKKHSTIRRRLAPSTLLQFFSTVGTFWVPPEQLWHPKWISSFFDLFSIPNWQHPIH